MMEPLARNEIIAVFGASKHLVLPNLKHIDWDVVDYLGWVHPSGHRGFLVHESPLDGRIRGTTLHRSHVVNRYPRLEMCSLCYQNHETGGTAMFTIDEAGSRGRHRIGQTVCKDLDCSLRIRNLVNDGGEPAETNYLQARIRRMQRRLHRWLKSADKL